MADIGSWPTGRSFVFSIEKQLVSDPSKQWINSYEAISIASGGLVDIIALGHALRDFELQLHPNTVNFTKWIARTGARDSKPYNPSTFYQEPIGVVGTNGRSMTSPLDLSISLWLNRAVIAGRAGKLGFRGVLQETDIEAPAGKISLTPAAKLSWDTDVNAAEAGTIRQYFSGGSSPVLRLIMIGPTGQYPRPLLDINVNGVWILKKFHKFFNRSGGVNPSLPVDIPTDNVTNMESWADQANKQAGLPPAP